MFKKKKKKLYFFYFGIIRIKKPLGTLKEDKKMTGLGL